MRINTHERKVEELAEILRCAVGRKKLYLDCGCGVPNIPSGVLSSKFSAAYMKMDGIPIL